MSDRAVPPPRIEAGEVVLRQWRSEDAPALLDVVTASLEHLRPWMPWAQQVSTASIAAFLRDATLPFRPGGDAVYAVVTPPSGSVPEEIVGSTGLHRRADARTLAIGYWIRVDRVRRGHATALTRALVDAAFRLPGIDRVEVRCDEANAASAAVPRRLGFRLERVDTRAPEAPGESGREMVWVMDRPG